MTMTTARKPFDVRALEREGDPGPFPILFDREYVMLDPKAMTFDEIFQVMQDFGNGKVLDALSGAVAEEDREDFLVQARQTPVFQLEGLLKAYREHYQFNLPEAVASSPT